MNGPAGPIVNIPKRSCRHVRERVHRASTSRWPNGAPLKVTKGTFKVAQYGAVLRRLFQMAQTRVGAGHGRRRRGSRPRSRALRRCHWARGRGGTPVRSPGLPRRDRPRRWGGHETTEPGLRQSGEGEGVDDALRADQGFDFRRGEFQDGINSFDGIRAGLSDDSRDVQGNPSRNTPLSASTLPTRSTLSRHCWPVNTASRAR